MPGIQAAKISLHTGERRDIAALSGGVAVGFECHSASCIMCVAMLFVVANVVHKRKGHKPKQNVAFDNRVRVELSMNYFVAKRQQVDRKSLLKN